MVCSGKCRQTGTGRVHDEVLCASNKKVSSSSPDIRGCDDYLQVVDMAARSHACEVIGRQRIKQWVLLRMCRESDACNQITWFGPILIATGKGDWTG
jgi:hypothetical protein